MAAVGHTVFPREAWFAPVNWDPNPFRAAPEDRAPHTVPSTAWELVENAEPLDYGQTNRVDDPPPPAIEMPPLGEMRAAFAAAALIGLIVADKGQGPIDQRAFDAVLHADCLIEALNKKKPSP